MANTVKDHRIATYSFVPGDIVYDLRINDAAVRIYAAISGLCGSKGYCCASNAWFAKKIGKTAWTVSRIIKKLNTAGCITIVISAPQGNRRYITTMTNKHLQILAMATTINGSKKTAELLSKTAIDLLSKTARPYCQKPQDPIAENDNHRIVVKEEEEGEEKKLSPPLFKKGSQEDLAYQNYLTVKERVWLMFESDFFDFFEEEVLGRFNKQEVSVATLHDWYSGIWKVYDPEVVVEFLKKQKKECTAWKVKWMQLNNRLGEHKNGEARRARRQAKEAEEAEKAKQPVDNRTLKERDMDLLKNEPDVFMERYNTNEFFRRIKDMDPEFKAAINKIKKKRKKA